MIYGALEILRSFLRNPAASRDILRALPFTLRGVEFSSGQIVPSAQRHPDSGSHDEGPPNDATALQAYFNSYENGPGIHKWLHYFDIYERHFKRFVGREVHVLEIGVESGGSLRMWRDYFGPGCHIYGVDIKEECKAFETDRTKIFIGDQEDRRFWQHFKREVPVLDILIDDGGHRPSQQIATLESMLMHIRPGGVYLCEDIHAADNRFGAYIAGLSASTNAWSCDDSPQLLTATTPFQASIDSIHIYPFVAVIERRSNPLESMVSVRRGTEWSRTRGERSSCDIHGVAQVP